jgi:hypothetical protein
MTSNKIVTGTLLLATLLCGGCPFGFCGASDSSETEATLYVSDAHTGQMIASPTFFEAESDLSANCSEYGNSSGCDSYLLVLSAATHEIRVSAPGYLPQTVTVDTSSTTSVHLAVELTAATQAQMAVNQDRAR